MPWKVVGFMHPWNDKFYGPLTVKRWVRGPWRKTYRTPAPTTLVGTPNERNEYLAIEYAKWLATRDGIAINHGDRWGKNMPKVEWSHFHSEVQNKFMKRIRSVRFPSGHRIEIPNWDFEQFEPREEIVSLPMRQLRKLAKTQRRRAA